MATLQIYLPDGSEIPHELTEQLTTVGRLPENLLAIDDSSISSQHAEIVHDGVNYFARDLGSTNGTFLNGNKIEYVMLNHGDELRFGSVVCLFLSESQVSATPLETESSQVVFATRSIRPENFKSSSPIIRKNNSKDYSKLALAAALVIGLSAAAGVVYQILQIQPLN
jgi:pSer/pThr/pTyr-binding forkhead associated (FHA) protein